MVKVRICPNCEEDTFTLYLKEKVMCCDCDEEYNISDLRIYDTETDEYEDPKKRGKGDRFGW